jgi:hypothetical protein
MTGLVVDVDCGHGFWTRRSGLPVGEGRLSQKRQPRRSLAGDGGAERPGGSSEVLAVGQEGAQNQSLSHCSFAGGTLLRPQPPSVVN